jgi:hypothetical protein
MSEVRRVLNELRRLGVNVEDEGDGWLIRRPEHSLPGILRLERDPDGWSLTTGPETGDDGPWDEWNVPTGDSVTDEVLAFLGRGLTDY